MDWLAFLWFKQSFSRDQLPGTNSLLLVYQSWLTRSRSGQFSMSSEFTNSPFNQSFMPLSDIDFLTPVRFLSLFMYASCSSDSNLPDHKVSIFFINDPPPPDFPILARIKHIVTLKKEETNMLMVVAGGTFSCGQHESKGFPAIDAMNHGNPLGLYDEQFLARLAPYFDLIKEVQSNNPSTGTIHGITILLVAEVLTT